MEDPLELCLLDSQICSILLADKNLSEIEGFLYYTTKYKKVLTSKGVSYNKRVIFFKSIEICPE